MVKTSDNANLRYIKMQNITQILEFLVCPLSKTSLIYDKEHNRLISLAAKIAYPIRDGIPVMLPDEASPLSDEYITIIQSKINE